MAFTLVTVTATIIEHDNATPAKGYVDFQLSNDIADQSGGRILARARRRAVLDNNGEISVTLAATDDVTTSPQGSLYLVTESIVGAPTRTYYIEVPAASPGGTVDLASVSPVPPGAVYVAGPTGPTGPIGPQGSQGDPGPVNSVDGQDGAVDLSASYAKPPITADAVMYITATGDDGSSGLSWGKAKATLASAISAGARRVMFGKGTFPAASLVTPMGNVTVDGSGPGETIWDFSSLTGTDVALDFTAGGPVASNRPGPTINNLTVKGPGIGTSTTGIKPYTGFSPRDLEVLSFGTGFDIDEQVGISLDRSVEVRACGLGFRTNADSNQNYLALRVLSCTKGCIIESNQVVVEAWFELCTGTEIEIKNANSIHFRGMWCEHARTDPSIVLEPTASAHPLPLLVSFKDSFITQGGGTHFMRIAQAIRVVLENLRLNDSGYAAIKVDKWVMDLDDRGIYIATGDGETDKSVRIPLRILGPGKIYSVTMPNDMVTRPFERRDPRPLVGGFADAASTNLISDSGFETALNATGNGPNAPTVTQDASAAHGSFACKAVFPAAGAGTTGYLRIDKNVTATAGQWYVLQYEAKANKDFRGMALRMFNVTPSGSFEDFPLPFMDLTTTYRRFTIIWEAPTTGDWRLTFYKTEVTSNPISFWVDDIAVWAGSVPGLYLPGRTTAISAGSVAAVSIALGQDVTLSRSAANTLRAEGALSLGGGATTVDDVFVRSGASAEVAIGQRGPSSQACITLGQLRDTNLYRFAADTLKTDDKFLTNAGLGVGNSVAATTLGTVARKMEIFNASGVSLGFIAVYDAIT